MEESEKKVMSKYAPLWEYIQKNGSPSFQLTFEEIEDIAGIPIDHSFLKYKKELTDYGYQVGKISMKGQTVQFHKIDWNGQSKHLTGRVAAHNQEEAYGIYSNFKP